MTEQEHLKVSVQIKGRITRLKAILRLPMNLAEKIKIKHEIAACEESLRQHRLNFFVLTQQPSE